MIELEFIPTIRFTRGTFKNVPLLYHDSYGHFRTSKHDWLFKQHGLFKYYLRHADDTDWLLPASIEENIVMVNYVGFILTKVDLMEMYPNLVVRIDGPHYEAMFINVDGEEEAYGIVDGANIDYEKFIAEE